MIKEEKYLNNIESLLLVNVKRDKIKNFILKDYKIGYISKEIYENAMNMIDGSVNTDFQDKKLLNKDKYLNAVNYFLENKLDKEKIKQAIIADYRHQKISTETCEEALTTLQRHIHKNSPPVKIMDADKKNKTIENSDEMYEMIYIEDEEMR